MSQSQVEKRSPSSLLRKACILDCPKINEIINHESVKERFSGGDAFGAYEVFDCYLTENDDGAFFVYRHSPIAVSLHVCCLPGCDTVRALKELDEIVDHKVSLCAISKDNRKARMMAGAFGYKRMSEFAGKIIYQRVK